MFALSMTRWAIGYDVPTLVGDVPQFLAARARMGKRPRKPTWTTAEKASYPYALTREDYYRITSAYSAVGHANMVTP